MMTVSLVVAMAKNRVIGSQNRLPWNLPGDLKRFKEITLGHPIIMGRKTYESIGRLLPGRENIIISRQPGYTVAGATCLGSLEAAISHCESKGASEACVIGGAEIFKLAIPLADKIYLTVIDREFEGDVRLPEWDETKFRETAREPREENGLSYSFLVLEKR